MAETEPPPPNEPSAPPAGSPLMTAPPVYSIPTQLLEEWMKIPQSEYINSRLTRADVDQLLFGLSKSFYAQDALQRCILKWSNGDNEGANLHMAEAQKLMTEGQNEVRHFFAALMFSVVQGRRPNG